MTDWNTALQNAESEMWDTIVDGEREPMQDSRRGENLLSEEDAMLPAVVHNSEAASSWPEIKAVPEGNVECDGCRGDGVHYGRGAVVNGVFVGFTGVCFRCGGKGSQTESDRKRNRCYDRHRTFTL